MLASPAPLISHSLAGLPCKAFSQAMGLVVHDTCAWLCRRDSNCNPTAERSRMAQTTILTCLEDNPHVQFDRLPRFRKLFRGITTPFFTKKKIEAPGLSIKETEFTEESIQHPFYELP